MASNDDTDPTPSQEGSNPERTPPEAIQPIPTVETKPTRGAKEPPPDPPRN